MMLLNSFPFCNQRSYAFYLQRAGNMASAMPSDIYFGRFGCVDEETIK